MCIGPCFYTEYKPGDRVEISIEGWQQGLAVNYAYTVGTVVKYKHGILTVLREGTTVPQDFRPCYWYPISEEDCEAVRIVQKKECWLDHVAIVEDDLALSDE